MSLAVMGCVEFMLGLVCLTGLVFVSFWFRVFWMDLLVFRWVGRCRDEGILMCGDVGF